MTPIPTRVAAAFVSALMLLGAGTLAALGDPAQEAAASGELGSSTSSVPTAAAVIGTDGDFPPHQTTTTTTVPTTTTTVPPTTVPPPTTAPPPPPPPPTTAAPAYTGGGNGDPYDMASWDRLAQCESGGNWSINTGNGYYGGIQFSLSSWRAVGGTGYPHEHSREEQIRRGQMLWEQGGWGHWPGCTRKFGWR